MAASEAEGRAEALRRIAACRAAQADELDLGGLQLTALDDELLKPLCELTGSGGCSSGPTPRCASRRNWLFIEGERNIKAFNALGELPGALFDALTRLAARFGPQWLRGAAGLDGEARRPHPSQPVLQPIGPEGTQALKGLAALTDLNMIDKESGPMGRRRSRASSPSPISTCPPTKSGTRGRRR